MNIELPSLYPHQVDIVERVRSSLATNRRVILCAGCGVGKTRMSKWILGAALNREQVGKGTGRYLWCVHRRGLVANAEESFAESPSIPFGVVMSGRETMYGRRLQLASVDTLLNWTIDDGKYSSDFTFDMIVWDECHSHHSKFARFLQYHDDRRLELGLHPAYVIGLSATPQAKGLADVYKEIVLGPSTEELTNGGFLSPFRYFRGTLGKLDLLVKRGNEFTSDSEAAAMSGMAGDMLRDWKKFAEGRPTVGFFPRRTHAQEALVTLQEAGLRVEYVDGETPDDERKRIFRALNNHDIDYCANVAVIERGSDIPRIGCIQLCVAIGSVVRYRQMIGRGSRVHPAKTDCLVLDHGGNVARHGFFDDDVAWSLDITTKDPGEQGTRPVISCPVCDRLYRGGACKSCGYEPTPRERRSQGLEFDGRELQEVTRKEKASSTKSPEELMIAALYKSGHSRRTWKQCVGIYFHLNEEQGTRHRVPRRVTVGGHTYEMVRYGSPDGGRLVGVLYPFTVGRGDHSGPYLVRESEYAS